MAAEGYAEKIKDDLLIQRFAAYRIACSMAGSKAIGDIERFWPIETERAKPKQISRELYNQIVKRHKLKLKNG
jgi:hypothetical protein